MEQLALQSQQQCIVVVVFVRSYQVQRLDYVNVAYSAVSQHDQQEIQSGQYVAEGETVFKCQM